MSGVEAHAGLPWRQSRLQVTATWQWGANQGPAWRAWAVRGGSALGLALVTAAVLHWLPREAAGPVLAMLTLMLACVLFALIQSTLLRLDHPHAARLVPGHVTALRRSAVLSWLAVSVPAALVITAWLAWSGHAQRPPLPVVLAFTAALLAFVAAALRWWGLWVLLWLAPLVTAPPGLRGPLHAGLVAVWSAWLQHPWVGCAGVLLVTGAGVAALFGRGDSAHLQAYARREQLRRIAEAGLGGQKPPLEAYGGWLAVLTRPWRRLADAWLARCLARARPDVPSVMARLEIVLHGQQHWLRQAAVIVPLLVLVAASLVVVVLLARGEPRQMLEGAKVGLSIGMASLAVGALASLPGALWVSRREQALLVLLPGVPRGAALNRALAWRQARHMAGLWTLGTLPLLAVAVMTDSPYLVALALVPLAMAPLLWRDASRACPPNGRSGALPYLACLTLGLASMALLRELPAAWWPWSTGLLVFALATGVWRWRRLAVWPAALPAGRQ